jgi:cobalamin-dependent methionine synthase I
MAVKDLSIIGESLNDSIPSTNQLFESGDLTGLVDLARRQDQKGADYIDVNVGPRSPELMAELVRRVQDSTHKPLAIDTPDFNTAKAGMEAYDLERAEGAPPILNSISRLRLNMFDLYQSQVFKPILMISERLENGTPQPNRTAEECYRTAKEMLKTIEEKGLRLPVEQCIVDPGIAPLASDSEGHLKRVLQSMKMIHDDPDFPGIHMSVGLSNFTIMLPSRRADGSLVKSPLESAFITLAMPLGLDMIIGSVARKYELLPEDHPAMECLNDIIELDGFDAITRVIQFYS